MKTIEGGTSVSSGHYLNVRTWELIPISTDGEALPGAPHARFVRISTPALFALAPLLGGLFVVFMPVIGFVLTAHALVARPSTAQPALASGADAELS